MRNKINVKNKQNIKVLIVEDHPATSFGISQSLSLDSKIRVLDTALNGQDAIFKAISCRPDIILMDIGLPDISGLEAARVILEKDTNMKIIMLTANTNSSVVSEALYSGVKGYLYKGSFPEEMISAIYKVNDGGFCFSDEITQLLALSQKQKSKEPNVSLNNLSSREKQTVELIIQGKTNQEIADALYVTYKSVAAKKEIIRQKLHIRNDVELVLLALKQGHIKIENGSIVFNFP